MPLRPLRDGGLLPLLGGLLLADLRAKKASDRASLVYKDDSRQHGSNPQCLESGHGIPPSLSFLLCKIRPERTPDKELPGIEAVQATTKVYRGDAFLSYPKKPRKHRRKPTRTPRPHHSRNERSPVRRTFLAHLR